MNLYWAIPFIVGIFFLLHGLNIQDDFVENKSQLQQITGVIPEKNTYKKSSRYYSTTYLEVADKAFHCMNNVHDDCHRIYQYKGQVATILYQPNTANGNLAYEIVINNEPIYEFNQQKAFFLQQKSLETHQWLWTLVLLVLPTIWLGCIDRKIRKSLPKMTKEELANFQKWQNENTESTGCLGFFGMMIFLTISIGCGTFSMIMFMGNDLPSAFLLAVVTVITAFVTYLCVKPKKKTSNIPK